MDKTIAASTASQEKVGATLVFLSALVLELRRRHRPLPRDRRQLDDRLLAGAVRGLFLLGFLVFRDGPRETLRLYRNMGIPGLLVGIGFATASTCFIIAISYTTVANVVLIQAGVPLFAALMAWIIYRESISFTTWIAIVAVIIGVAIMVMGGPFIAQADDMLGFGLIDNAATARRPIPASTCDMPGSATCSR